MSFEKYNDKYGNLPKNHTERFTELLRGINLKEKDIDKLQVRLRRLVNMPTNSVSFIIYMVPTPTPRPRMGRFGRFYVQGAKDNSNLFKAFIEAYMSDHSKITTPTKFRCDLYMPMPSGFTASDRILAELRMIKVISRPDWDNLGKTYSDMVQEHLLQEDSLIYDGHVRKFYSTRPRVELSFEYDEFYDCKHSKKSIEKWKSYDPDRSEERDVL